MNANEAINKQMIRVHVETACTDAEDFDAGLVVAFAAAVLLALQIQEQFRQRFDAKS